LYLVFILNVSMGNLRLKVKRLTGVQQALNMYLTKRIWIAELSLKEAKMPPQVLYVRAVFHILKQIYTWLPINKNNSPFYF